MDLQAELDFPEFKERVEQFCAIYCPPEQEFELDRNPVYPEALHQAMASSGLLSHCLPKALGGSDGTLVELCMINEILARHSMSATNILFINGICAALMAMAGSPEQQETYVKGIAEGRLKFSFALTEPNAGSDAAGIQASATADSEGYRINGTKLYTTGADVADYILTAVRTDSEGKASRSVSLFIVPTASEGLSIAPLDKIAGNDVASCQVEYRNVTVPTSARLGEENAGWSTLMLGGGLERLSVAACCIGAAQASLDEVLEHVKHRKQFGQPVGQFQAVQHQIADMATRLEAMNLLTYSAARKLQAGRPAVREISMAKVFAAEGAHEIITYGMRLLGAKAYLSETAMPRRMRESFLAMYAGGTPEIQRNLIARDLGL
ncbi:alkylation response protein AidB-like acyl-CoA dehydrogenase [Litorivivens lipolytica]|uniref:Alkylation response protein AidB-like acyl-CoA dehydrogenase n=1 Tax=Litorivivens lipolytica TaxID=1524264 RepID=A0A7W4W3B8_9GAMM|nr:acyl-CoA dehydrogenase family protein [Litorivivens lipolytica]MBB3046614.1 alkylation response protein AidB-like acyl-CoA dehydrogenase [Litorivivens lipolytica]